MCVCVWRLLGFRFLRTSIRFQIAHDWWRFRWLVHTVLSHRLHRLFVYFIVMAETLVSLLPLPIDGPYTLLMRTVRTHIQFSSEIVTIAMLNASISQHHIVLVRLLTCFVFHVWNIWAFLIRCFRFNILCKQNDDETFSCFLGSIGLEVLRK